MENNKTRMDDGDTSLISDSVPPTSKVSTEDVYCPESASENKADEDLGFNLGLNQQRLEEKYTNVVIECNGVKFPAHNYVLACQSNFFFKAFSSPSMLCTNPTITLDEYQPNVVEVVLDYLYTDDINLYKISVDDLEMLVSCCRELEVVNFESCLLKALVNDLKPENFHFALLLAKSNMNAEAQAKVLSYVCENLDIIWPNDEFMVLEEDNLQEVLHEASKKFSHHDILLDSLLKWIKMDVSTRGASVAKLMSHINFDKISKTSATSLAEYDSVVNSSSSLKSELMRVAMRDADNETESTVATTSASEVSVSGLSYEDEEPILLFVGRNEFNSGTAVTYEVHTHQWFVPCDLKLSLYHNPGIGYDSGRILLVGGRDINNVKLSAVSAYRLSDQKPEVLPDLRIARENPLVFVYENAVYVFGGSGRYSSDGLTHGEYLSDGKATSWKVLPPMRVKRSGLVTACKRGAYIFLTGGGSVEVEKFSLKRMVWEVLPPLPIDVFLDGKAFISNAGGELWALNEFKARDAHLYNQDAGLWDQIPLRGVPPETIIHTIAWKEIIYVLDTDKNLFLLDVTTKTWTAKDKIPKSLPNPCYMGLL